MLRRGLRRVAQFVGLRRFIVSDTSMEPTLMAGQGLVTRRGGRVEPGQLRCLEHPHRPGFWLVKRVCEVVEGTGGASEMLVSSDNDGVAAVDSRRFGSVPVEGSYRVLFAVPIRWM